MTPRTVEKYVDSLDREYAWRQKELSCLLLEVKSAEEKTRGLRLRSAVALLYAHWEGFIKSAATEYLQYVAEKRMNLEDLNDGLISVGLRSRLKEFYSTNDISAHMDFVNLFRDGLAKRARLPKENVIKTQSNLNSKRFKRIVLQLGIDYTPFELQEHRIDAELLKWRNDIAHGERVNPDEGEFYSLYEKVVLMLRTFKDLLSNAATQEEYKRQIQ